MLSEQLNVSIIITVRNSGIDLSTTMDTLKVSRVNTPYEVIIVDEDSIDGCCDFLFEYRFNHPFRKYKGRPDQSARNIGATHANGDYLVFASASIYYNDDWLEKLLEPLLEGTATAVSPVFKLHSNSRPRKIRKFEEGLLSTIQQYPRVMDGTGMEIPWLSSECLMVSKERFQELGGFTEGFRTKDVEAAEFSLRNWLHGGRNLLVPEVCMQQVYRNNFPHDEREDKWEEDLEILEQLHRNNNNSDYISFMDRFGIG